MTQIFSPDEVRNLLNYKGDMQDLYTNDDCNAYRISVIALVLHKLKLIKIEVCPKELNEAYLTELDDFLKTKNIITENSIKFGPEVAGVLIVAALSTSLFCSFYYGGLIVEQEMIVQSFCGISTSLELLELGALTIAVPIGIAVIAAMISGVMRNKDGNPQYFMY